MTIDAEFREWLSQRIEAYCCDDAEPDYLKIQALRHTVLPLFVDWTGFWGISPDGSILLVDTEDGAPPTLENDARVQRMALFRGAEKYPEIQTLVPRRPESARDCPNCEGRGVINLPGIGPDTIVCYCGGLGWLNE